MTAILVAWLAAFLFTQLIEVPIYVYWLKCPPLVAFGASAITHPIVWFGFFHPTWHAPYVLKLVLAEVFAWLVEAGYFGLIFRRPRALLVALVANVASASLGLLSRWLFGAP